MSEFSEEKLNRLSSFDSSRKGSVDAQILGVVQLINSFPQYYTTSSCAGRTVIFSNSEANNPEGGYCIQKKGCIWHHVTHEKLDCNELESSLEGHSGSAVLKFEPFILHVRCSTLEDARKLVAVSVAAGCRNSGITLNRAGKLLVAVRSTLSMEVPLSKNGELLVSHTYLCFLVEEANTKMEENWKRLRRFFEGVCSLSKEIDDQTPRRRRPRVYENKTSVPDVRDIRVESPALQEDYSSEVAHLFVVRD
ncbi:tRNA wybutosine-synthesizing protein 3 homolog [Ornithodoros turicata]|uniref:tRNA wybutosine-synthesizing protein 3 homolog n=1 Tax=Ornithodoros turicata TaxID=34597 RepID=UPI003139833D